MERLDLNSLDPYEKASSALSDNPLESPFINLNQVLSQVQDHSGKDLRFQNLVVSIGYISNKSRNTFGIPVVGQPPGEQYPDFHHFVRFPHYKILEPDLLTRISQVCLKNAATTGHCERERSNLLVHEIAASLCSSQ